MPGSGAPLVSVVLPVRNPGPFLEEAVASIVAQSERGWEVVVVDDGGDEDVSWVRDVDERIRLISKEPGGVSVARNLGIAATKAPLVAFIDQDDVWKPDKLQHQIAALDRTSRSFSYSQFDLLYDESSNRVEGYGREVTFVDVLGGEMGVLLSSLMVRRSALERVGGFLPLLRMQQDLELVLRLLREGPGAYVDLPLVTYRLHAANASGNYWRTAEEMALVLTMQEMAIAPDDPRATAALRTGRARTRRTYAEQALDATRVRWHEGKRRSAAVSLGHAARLDKGAPVRFFERAVRARVQRR